MIRERVRRIGDPREVGREVLAAVAVHFAADAGEHVEAVIQHGTVVVQIAGLVLGFVAVHRGAIEQDDAVNIGGDFRAWVPLREDLLDSLDDAEAVTDDLVDWNVTGGNELGQRATRAIRKYARVTQWVRGAGDLGVADTVGGNGIVLLHLLDEHAANEEGVLHAPLGGFEDQVELMILHLAIVAGGVNSGLSVEGATVSVGLDVTFLIVEHAVFVGENVAGIHPAGRGGLDREGRGVDMLFGVRTTIGPVEAFIVDAFAALVGVISTVSDFGVKRQGLIAGGVTHIGDVGAGCGKDAGAVSGNWVCVGRETSGRNESCAGFSVGLEPAVWVDPVPLISVELRVVSFDFGGQLDLAAVEGNERDVGR